MSKLAFNKVQELEQVRLLKHASSDFALHTSGPSTTDDLAEHTQKLRELLDFYEESRSSTGKSATKRRTLNLPKFQSKVIRDKGEKAKTRRPTTDTSPQTELEALAKDDIPQGDNSAALLAQLDQLQNAFDGNEKLHARTEDDIERRLSQLRSEFLKGLGNRLPSRFKLQSLLSRLEFKEFWRKLEGNRDALRGGVYSQFRIWDDYWVRLQRYCGVSDSVPVDTMKAEAEARLDALLSLAQLGNPIATVALEQLARTATTFLNSLQASNPDIFRSVVKQNRTWPLVDSLHPALRAEKDVLLRDLGKALKRPFDQFAKWDPNDVATQVADELRNHIERWRHQIKEFVSTTGVNTEELEPKLVRQIAKLEDFEMFQPVAKTWWDVAKEIFDDAFPRPHQNDVLKRLATSPKSGRRFNTPAKMDRDIRHNIRGKFIGQNSRKRK